MTNNAPTRGRWTEVPTPLPREARIFVAGHQGMVGRALVRCLNAQGAQTLITRTHAEVDLTDAAAVNALFATEKPEYVFLAAAKVGGIHANSHYPADFIAQNLAIQTNVIAAAHQHGVRRFLFLGSSCIYPRDCPQPIKESYLLTGPLEPTNRPYAVAKIAGIEMCWAHNRQHPDGTRFIAVMPSNLYGLGDTYHPDNAHVIPALLQRAHESKLRGDREFVVWGSGQPRREFVYADDLADACHYLMAMSDPQLDRLLPEDAPPLINVGLGNDITIAQLAREICTVVGFDRPVRFDSSKPDGTPRKLLDVTRLHGVGWRAQTPFAEGLRCAYQDFLTRFP